MPLSRPAILLALTLVLPLLGAAQTFPRLDIPVTVDGVNLQAPFTGGLNAPQFSEVDLDGDGKLDLYIFDRIGGVHLTFLNLATQPGETNYAFAPEYIPAFPPVDHYVLLRDYDGDGVADIFASAGDESIPGLKVYKGRREGSLLAFDRIRFPCFQFDVLPVRLSNGSCTNVLAQFPEYPAIDDLDGDGDLDVLSTALSGAHLVWYQNRSVEEGFGRDSLLFVIQDDCWGRFAITPFSPTFNLSPDGNECANPFHDPTHPHEGPLHGGSTLLTIDMDNDGDKDLFYGDLLFPTINFGRNGGTPQSAWITEQDPTFDSDGVSVEIPDFPAAYWIDLDNDGLKDFVAAPNNINATLDREVVWFYKNLGSNETPAFAFQQRDLLVNEMLDFGTGANPALADVNGDGLTDLVVGNHDHTLLDDIPGDIDSRLRLFLNVGSASEPAFELADDDWLGFRSLAQVAPNPHSFAPTFADLDQDGDLDLLVGERFGSLFFAENLAGPGNPMQFGPIEPNWQGINVGQFSTPAVADLDRDGLPDLVIGERNGNLNFFPNQGSVGNPQFHPVPDEAPNNPFLGQINTSEPFYVTGYSAPVVLGSGDSLFILSGSEEGSLQLYFVEPANLASGPFPQVNPRFGGWREGTITRPALADLTGDDILEMVVGNWRGGLGAFGTNFKMDGTVSATAEVAPALLFTVSPNPTQGTLLLQLSPRLLPARVQLFDLHGKLLLESPLESPTLTLNLQPLPPGLYLLQALLPNGEIIVRKVLKNR